METGDKNCDDQAPRRGEGPRALSMCNQMVTGNYKDLDKTRVKLFLISRVYHLITC